MIVTFTFFVIVTFALATLSPQQERLGAIYPAFKAAEKDPIDALAYE